MEEEPIGYKLETALECEDSGEEVVKVAEGLEKKGLYQRNNSKVSISIRTHSAALESGRFVDC